jgi:hypothetical protein
MQVDLDSEFGFVRFARSSSQKKVQEAEVFYPNSVQESVSLRNEASFSVISDCAIDSGKVLWRASVVEQRWRTDAEGISSEFLYETRFSACGEGFTASLVALYIEGLIASESELGSDDESHRFLHQFPRISPSSDLGQSFDVVSNMISEFWLDHIEDIAPGGYDTAAGFGSLVQEFMEGAPLADDTSVEFVRDFIAKQG